ncbi:MAG: IS91 family transposase [Aureispira sp.]|nr:IS91 family transposase [Aureispira sp.]
MCKKATISRVFERFGLVVKQRYKLSKAQHKVLNLVGICQTGKLGAHKEKCNSCGYKKIHYNSCGNRHCPNCQGVKKERWFLDREYDLLPIKYFHGVFTMPSELRSLFRYNKKVLYNLLFKCSWETIKAFSLDRRQKMEAKAGMIGILHTWTQKMDYHPHLHCIIPSGGITEKGKWKTSKGKKHFMFSVRALSSKFKQKFLHHLVALFKAGKLRLPPKDMMWNSVSKFYATKRKLYLKKWVVYAKESFGGAEQVLEYLGRYTHRIAISNYRILKVTSTHVIFKYLDRKKKSTARETVTGEEFILRFLQHVLPKGFTKIRHYGFLSSRSKGVDLPRIRKALKVKAPPVKKKLSSREVMLETQGKDPYLCPKCQEVEMVIVEIMHGIRGSPMRFFAKDKKVQLV